MKLKREVDSYKLPPIGMMVGTLLEVGPNLVAMMQVKPETIEHERDKSKDRIVGVPVMFALRKGTTDGLELWPSPDQDYELRVRYYPPAVEL